MLAWYKENLPRRINVLLVMWIQIMLVIWIREDLWLVMFSHFQVLLLVGRLTNALSITEAEYMAGTEAIKEAIWLKRLVTDLGLQQETTVVHCDSQSIIHLIKNQ